MTRRQAMIVYSPLIAAAVLFLPLLAYEGCVVAIGDGSLTVVGTVRSATPLKVRRVSYDGFWHREDVEECLRNPPPNEILFRDAAVNSPRSFQFEVLTSSRISPFGILTNRFRWCPFAVFRIETDSGDVYYVGAEVPDVRQTRAIPIDIP